jgi:uncharacterized repeat protein (TIGR01451 family)
MVPLLLITALSVMPAPVGHAVAINVDTSDGDGSLHETIQATSTNAADDLDITNDPMAPTATFVVDIITDTVDTIPGDGMCADANNDCSLRAAIMEANALAGADDITLPSGIYTLTIPGTLENACATGDLDITTDDLIINGAGAGSSIINGGAIDRVLHVPYGGITVTINNVTITNGNSDWGGGIHNESGVLTINNSTISDNYVTRGGGGIRNWDGVLTINNCTISDNYAGSMGGGIHNKVGVLTMSNSTISGNTAVSRSGGIDNDDSDVATLTNCTVSGNSAEFYGAILNIAGAGYTSVVTLTHCTISDNSGVRTYGNGLTNRSNGGTATSYLQNSILAGNTTGGGTDCWNNGTLTSLDYNLDGDGTCSLIQAHDLPSTDPRLGPLADNGGDTYTHELLSGSPAIDHIPVGSCPVATDQRGILRPQGAACDIGAYELIFGLTKSATPTTPVNPGQTITYTLVYTNTAYDPATGIVITDVVPISVTNVAYTYSGATITPTGGITYAWEVEDLPLNARVIITITGEISPGLPGGVFTNTIMVAVNGTIMGSATAPITVNYAPVADAGVDQSVSLSTLVTLDGSGSDDPVDHHLPLTYGWTQTGGTPVTLSSATVSQPTFTAPGAAAILTFTLTVTDSLGRPDLTPDEVVIFVHDIPVAGLSAANSSTTTLGCPTHFTATITAGSSVEYKWAFGDGLTSTGAMAGPYANIADHIYDHTLICGKRVATYTAIVTATNTPTTTTYILTDTTYVTITNDPPVADAGPHQEVLVDDLVTLDGSGSYDPDYPCNDIVEYNWVQTGGPTATLSSNTAVTPTFTAPGAAAILTFTLTVTDTGCLTATNIVTVTITLPVGGYTEMASPSALLWPRWVALAAAVGVATAVVAAMLEKRRERKMPSQ